MEMHATLVPSQIATGANNSNNSNNVSNASSGNNHRQRPGNNQNNMKRQSESADQSNNAANATSAAVAAAVVAAAVAKTNGEVINKNINRQQQQQKQQNNRNQNRRRRGGEKKPPSGPAATDNDANEKKQANDSNKKRRQRNNRHNNNNRKRYSWRRHIPAGSIDPITLDPLVSLPYPPFALVAAEPFEPVPEWPVPEQKQEEKDETKRPTTTIMTQEERSKQILQEQWGSLVKASDNNDNNNNNNNDNNGEKEEDDTAKGSRRHYHLYDGRALAYYLVSQLQFIDPLNRRDLTRDELLNLDRYLQRHGFTNANVVQAYDTKGVTLSTAGAVGNTAFGRAEILRQQAQGLLDALFRGTSTSSTTPTTTTTNSLQQQYAASQEANEQQRRQQRQQPRDEGIYGDDDGGIVIIDDDLNPGLRGDVAFQQQQQQHNTRLNQSATSFTPGTLWSASRIASQFSHTANVQAQNFPALPTASSPSPAAANTTTQASNLSASRSLKRITKVVAKTDPRELQRQREAREMFVRRAMMSNLEYGAEVPAAVSLPPGLPATVTTTGGASAGAAPTEGQIMRNQALATALRVVPSTVRHGYNSGWARPITRAGAELDEFGSELNVTQYPDALILQARERMTLLLKLEKKWKQFLTDDTAASLPLNHMDKPARTFVHHYSDFWNLHTESFDPEPKRYIHCVKLRDTAAPNPLLSKAARNWRGPTITTPVAAVTSASAKQLDTAPTQQAAGQTPREMPPPPERQPLKLKPRSVPVVAPPGAMFDLTDVVAAVPTEAQVNTRSNELFTGRERPRLELAPRTIPLGLPKYEPTKAYNLTEERERQQLAREEQQRKVQEEQEKKRRLLEAAFASDDEEASLASHDSEDWDDDGDAQKPEVTSDDEDQE